MSIAEPKTKIEKRASSSHKDHAARKDAMALRITKRKNYAQTETTHANIMEVRVKEEPRRIRKLSLIKSGCKAPMPSVMPAAIKKAGLKWYCGTFLLPQCHLSKEHRRQSQAAIQTLREKMPETKWSAEVKTEVTTAQKQLINISNENQNTVPHTTHALECTVPTKTTKVNKKI